MHWLKESILESISEIKKNPKQAVKEFAMCVCIFAVCCGMLFLSAIMTGCKATQSTSIKGKATIITVDTTTVRHTGTLKFDKGLFNK